MAHKQPIKTTTNTSTPILPTLPPGQTFDILPPLHELLARVDRYHAQQSSSNDLPMLGDNNLVEPLEDGDIGCAYPADLDPLNPKDFPTAVLGIKGKIRTALKEVEKLPEVERSVEEQQEEIKELEERIQKQKEMIRSLAEVAKSMEERVGG